MICGTCSLRTWPQGYLEKASSFIVAGYESNEFDDKHVYRQVYDIRKSDCGAISLSSALVVMPIELSDKEDGPEWKSRQLEANSDTEVMD